MSLEFDLEIQRKNNAYTFVARQFGVVVRATDLSSGAREAEMRIIAVAAEAREDKIADSASTSSSVGARASSQSIFFFTSLAVFGVVLFALFWIAGPLSNVTGYFGANAIRSTSVIESIFRRTSNRINSEIVAQLGGLPKLGPEIASTTIPSTSDTGTRSAWLTTGPARVDADGTATTGSEGQIYQLFPVPKFSTTVYGTLSATGNIWNASTILDVIWYEDQREISRSAESWRAVKDRAIEAEFIYSVPAAATRLQLIVRTWRPQDGLVKVSTAKVSWYHPDASANAPSHSFNIR
jgi:hypothetical protein